VRLQDLDFDENNKVVQGKGKKDRYVPLSIHLIRGLKNTLQLKNQ
jgi:integrase